MELGSKRKFVSCTNSEKCGMMCAKGGEECIEEELSNLFGQGFFDVFPERMRIKRINSFSKSLICESAPFAPKTRQCSCCFVREKVIIVIKNFPVENYL